MDNQTEITAQPKISLISLPGGILDWLNSEEVFKIFLSLEGRFKIPNEKVRVLPTIVEDLAEGALSPMNAAKKIASDLSLPDQDAVEILKTIKEGIINPIATHLQALARIDLTTLPGAMPIPAQTLKLELNDEVKKTTASPTAPTTNSLEPLIASPRIIAATGMETPGLRVMKDVKAPQVKKAEPAQPRIEPSIVETPRPFMLHEEKPLAPSEPAALKVSKNFSFDAGEAPINRAAAHPATARLDSSFDAMLGQTKPTTPVTAKTVEAPKVVHYTSMRTPLADQDRPKS